VRIKKQKKINSIEKSEELGICYMVMGSISAIYAYKWLNLAPTFCTGFTPMGRVVCIITHNVTPQTSYEYDIMLATRFIRSDHSVVRSTLMMIHYAVH